MTEATRASQTTDYTYNDNSWVTGIDYPTGTTTDYLYNANGWMTDIDVKKSDNTAILDLVYTYDFNGNITSEPIGANTWEYTYDALNRLVAVNKPGTADDIVYTYDPRGNRTDIDVGTTDNTDLTFNVADQLTRVDYEDGDYHTFTYDNNGNCTNMSHYPDIFLNSPSPSGGRCHEVTDEGAFSSSPSGGGTQGDGALNSQSPENSPKHISANSNIQNSTYNNGTTCATSAQNTPISSKNPSPLNSKGEGARRAGEGAFSSSPSGGGTQGEGAFNSSYTPYELGKQYDTTSQEAKRTHYPHLLAPPSLRTANLPSTRPQRYLNPALWDAITLGNKTAESQLQAYMWQTESTCNPTRTFTPDSVTTYDYDYDNRLTTVNLPTNNDTVEYTYDATGRRLTKEYTYHNGANTDVTTYKYHYIGSQITEIEIDAIRNPGESQTTLRDEEIKIHLGANSQPISYEWVKHISGNTTSATCYYHYDIHGNVLKVTDSSENVKITYTYDTLGTILTETNPDSILNFFTFRGASQTIWEPETGLYYSGGYYRPDTGTALQGTGAPVLTNPASGAMLNSIAQATSANAQLAAHAAVSASSAGSSGGSFAPPPGSGDGLSQANCIATTPTTDSVEPIATITDGSSSNFFIGGWQKNDYEVHWKVKGSKKSDFKPKDEKSPLIGGGGSLDTGDMKKITKLGFGSDEEEEERDENGRTKKEQQILDYKELWDKFPELRPTYLIAGTVEAEAWGRYKQWQKIPSEIRKKIIAESGLGEDDVFLKLVWAVWGEKNGQIGLLGYQIDQTSPAFFWPDGTKYENVDSFSPYNFSTTKGWISHTLHSANFTGCDLVVWNICCKSNGKSTDSKTVYDGFKLYIPSNEGDVTEKGQIKKSKIVHADFEDGGHDPDAWKESVGEGVRFMAGSNIVIVMYSDGYCENWNYGGALRGICYFDRFTVIGNKKLWWDNNQKKWYNFFFQTIIGEPATPKP